MICDINEKTAALIAAADCKAQRWLTLDMKTLPGGTKAMHATLENRFTENVGASKRNR